MKNNYFILSIVFAVLTAFTVDNNILQRIGSSTAQMKTAAFFTIQADKWYLFSNLQCSIADCKKISAAERAAVVTQVAQVVKNYIASSQFTIDYLARLKNDFSVYHKPDMQSKEWQDKLKEESEKALAVFKSVSMDDAKMSFDGVKIGKEKILESLTNIDEATQKMYADAGLDKAKIQAEIAELNAIAAIYPANKNAFLKKYADFIGVATVHMTFDQELKSYNESLETYNKSVALDKNASLKMLLQSFLESSADIDFDAETIPGKYGKRIFKNEEYEQKSGEWKAYYRAGKAPVLAARTFAQQWLTELK